MKLRYCAITILALCASLFAQVGGGAVVGGGALFKGGAAATPAVVQVCGRNQSSGATTSTWAASCNSNIVVGHIVVIMWEDGNPTTPACSDLLGNSWSAPAAPAGAAGLLYCYSTITIGGADNVTMTTAGTNTPTSFSVEMSGVTVLDVADPNGASLTAQTSLTLPSVTTTAKGIVLGMGGDQNNNITYTAGGSYTIPPGTCGSNSSGACGQTSGGGESGFIEYLITTVGGANQPTATAGSAFTGFVETISFK